MMDELYDLCDNLKNEIKRLNQKNDISPTELERAYKAVDIIKDIKTIEAMEEAGGSYAGNYYDDYSNARRYYRDDYSQARRGRDSMGRYTSRDDGTSGHMDKEQMMRQIEEMKRKVEQM